MLRNIQQREGFSNRLLDEEIERNLDMDPRDRALATLLVYGVLRHRQRLDHHIDAAAHKPKKIKGELRTALRIACYEILELDRPLPIASAQASQALSSIDPQGRLRPVVGGVLRSVDAQAKKTEQNWQDPEALLCLRYSLPEWLAKRWLESLGAEKALARAAASLEFPWIDLRLRAQGQSREEIIAKLREDYPQASLKVPDEALHPHSLRIRAAGDLHFGPLYQSGALSIQSLGSQQAARLLQVKPGEKVMDACCGMGTKSMQLLEALQGQGQLVAVDSNASRLEQLPVQQQRLKLRAPSGGLSVRLADLCEHASLPEQEREDFDALMLDAPCSGLGNLARHPELRWTRSAEDLADREALQRKLLQASVARVKDGGRLVYAVCSLEAEEGPDLVAWACEQASIAGRQLILEEAKRWTPEEHACDGFYAARLRVRLCPP